MIARLADATEDIAEFRVVVEQAQQRLAACALFGNAEQMFGRRIEITNQEGAVENDDAGTE